MNSTLTSISNEESVARILHRDWVVDNRLQLGAFALRKNETYISGLSADEVLMEIGWSLIEISTIKEG